MVNAQQDRGFGLYAHLPYCVHRCSYCDFFSSTRYDTESFVRLARALQQEIAATRQEFENLPAADTVFLGGGTPSLFPVPVLAELFDSLHQQFPWKPGAEITLEANPETVSLGFLQGLKEATPINRISLGAQSFQEAHLRTLERRCQPQQVRQAAQWLRQTGYENFSVDLIFGIPSQSLADIVSDIQAAADLGPKHISIYQLTLSPGHKLYSQLPDEEFQADAYEVVCRELETRGFALYEISNFAREGFQCRHNLLYWTGGDFLGFGPSASSRLFRDGVCWHRKQRSDLDGYLKSPAPKSWEKTTKSQTVLEASFLELRTDTGVDVQSFKQRYGYDLLTSPRLSRFVTGNLLVLRGNRLQLTPQGRLLADGIGRDLVPDLF